MIEVEALKGTSEVDCFERDHGVKRQFPMRVANIITVA